MTIMGIQWLNYKETERSNKMRETISLASLDETKRSNRVDESIKQGNLDENIRSNKMKESISWSTLAENKRHNVVVETLGFNTLAETSRSNLAREKENTRTNFTNELIKVYNTDMNTFSKLAPGYAVSSSNLFKTLGKADQVFLNVTGGISNAGASINSLIPGIIKVK